MNYNSGEPTRMSNWGRWSSCTATCGGNGSQSRSRECKSGDCGWSNLYEKRSCGGDTKCPKVYCGKEFANLILKSGVCETYGWRTRENGGWCKLYEELSEPNWTIEEMDECGSYEECCGEGCIPEDEIGPEECF